MSTRVYVASPWIPIEWVRAHGLEPGGAWCAGDFDHPGLPLPAGVCAYAEMTVRFAETHPDDPVIFPTTCDQLRRGYDAALCGSAARAFLFNIPATRSSAARQLYRSELQRLGEFLCQLGGRTPGPELLRDEMLRAGRARQQLLASASTSPARAFATAVARFWRGQADSAPEASSIAAGAGVRRLNVPREHFREPPDVGSCDKSSVPLALVGGPLSVADFELLDAFEAAGGRVALNATEYGERSLAPAFGPDTIRGNPFDALADSFFDSMVDVFQRPNDGLYSWLKPRLESRGARGIVLWHFSGCDLWRAEAQTLRELLGLPVLPLEAGTGPGQWPRDTGRIEAFLETLR